MKQLIFSSLIILGVMLMMSSCSTTQSLTPREPASRIDWREFEKKLDKTLAKTVNLNRIQVQREIF